MRVVFRCDPALHGSLPRPHAAAAALPEWLRTMPRTAPSVLHPEPVRTVKQCPPFVDAMAHGFMIPLPCDVSVRGGALSWDWEVPPLAALHHPRAPISFHAAAQMEGSPFRDGDQVIVKFNSFWTVALEPGWSLFATHPVNRADLPFRLLTGLVNADRFNAVGLLFPAVWLDPAWEGTLPRGMPVAQCFPVPRVPLELVHEAFDAGAAQEYDALAGQLLGGPGVYRRQFRSGPGGPGPGGPISADPILGSPGPGGQLPLQGSGVQPDAAGRR